MDGTVDMLLRVAVALVLGGSIGLERELRDRAAGFRTHILVSVGAAAFTLSSIYGFEQVMTRPIAADYQFDPSRVAAQIVSGIGFLGAGAIIRHGVSVRGLTTAASLWAVAAIGMLSGLGMHGLALGTTVIVLIALSGLRFVEGIVLRRTTAESRFYVQFRRRGSDNIARLAQMLDAHGVEIKQLRTDPDDDESHVIHLQVDLPEDLNENRLLGLVGDLSDTARVDRE